MNLVYFLDGKAYINLTNACTNECKFCVRDIKDDVQGSNLWLEDKKVELKDLISQIDENKDKIISSGEIVYCGYGEPLSRYDLLIESAKHIKKELKDVKIRINTNGHGNVINKKDITPSLVGLVDSISISLNAQNEEEYNKISDPKIPNAYNEMLDFTKKCVLNKIDTVMSIVVDFDCDKYEIDEKSCEKIAQNIGAKFRARKWIKSGY